MEAQDDLPYLLLVNRENVDGIAVVLGLRDRQADDGQIFLLLAHILAFVALKSGLNFALE